MRAGASLKAGGWGGGEGNGRERDGRDAASPLARRVRMAWVARATPCRRGIRRPYTASTAPRPLFEGTPHFLEEHLHTRTPRKKFQKKKPASLITPRHAHLHSGRMVSATRAARGGRGDECATDAGGRRGVLGGAYARNVRHGFAWDRNGRVQIVTSAVRLASRRDAPPARPRARPAETPCSHGHAPCAALPRGSARVVPRASISQPGRCSRKSVSMRGGLPRLPRWPRPTCVSARLTLSRPPPFVPPHAGPCPFLPSNAHRLCCAPQPRRDGRARRHGVRAGHGHQCHCLQPAQRPGLVPCPPVSAVSQPHACEPHCAPCRRSSRALRKRARRAVPHATADACTCRMAEARERSRYVRPTTVSSART